VSLMTERPIAAGDKTVGQIDRVIVGVDDSSAGLAAMAAAVMLAKGYSAPLVAVRTWALGLPRHGGRRRRHVSHPHVILSFSDTEQRAAATVLISNTIKAAVGRLPDDVVMTRETPDADPAVALVTMATKAGDVIVVGTGGGHWVRRLIHGSVSRYCVKHARCPVIVVPAPDGPHRISGQNVSQAGGTDVS
jgi:nucleotide-binding universal stress UspA family protein